MKSVLSVALIVSLAGSPLTAAAPDPAGPIARTLQRHAEQLAAEPDIAPFGPNAWQGDQPAASDWSRIRKLQPGRKLVITVKEERPHKWTFGRADEDWMTVRDSEGERIIARSDVTEIAAVTTQGSAPAAIAGAGLGAWLGLDVAVGLGYTVRCQPSCGGVEAMMLLSAGGIPIAAALAGYHLFGHSTKNVIYRTPYAGSAIRP